MRENREDTRYQLVGRTVVEQLNQQCNLDSELSLPGWNVCPIASTILPTISFLHLKQTPRIDGFVLVASSRRWFKLAMRESRSLIVASLTEEFG